MLGVLLFVVNLHFGYSALWPKGIVHFNINSKDYDVHSQDIIVTALDAIQKEICIKFFNTPLNYTPSEDTKVLFISNPEKRKACPPDAYDFSGSVVDMIIGYKCLNTEDITRIIVQMLKAGIERTVPTVNSYDLMKKFEEQDKLNSHHSSLLPPKDRNYINAHYHKECVMPPPPLDTRRAEQLHYGTPVIVMTRENEEFYKGKLWPMGIVMYDLQKELRNTGYHNQLKEAMSTIELASCIVFQEMEGDDVLDAKSLLFFGEQGEEAPVLGFREGNQTISLSSMIIGAPGHTAHTLNLLFRALGVPMISNRYDREYFIEVHWNNVIKGKEHYLDRMPKCARLLDSRVTYDFDSVTHAPANYMCDRCFTGGTTVTPLQDILWQRTISMGHKTELSDSDKEILKVLYSKQCQQRFKHDEDEHGLKTLNMASHAKSRV